MSQRITIDPVTRIEGHLRIDCEIENGVVSKAWASGTMWRGIRSQAGPTTASTSSAAVLMPHI